MTHTFEAINTKPMAIFTIQKYVKEANYACNANTVIRMNPARIVTVAYAVKLAHRSHKQTRICFVLAATLLTVPAVWLPKANIVLTKRYTIV